MAVTLRKQIEVEAAGYRHRVGYQWEEIAHQGTVLHLGSREVPVGLSPGSYGQSHHAIVWNAETNEPEEIHLYTISYDYPSWPRESWYGWNHSAVVDATPEAQEAYQAWQEAEAEAKTQREHEANLEAAREAASEVRKGSFVFLSRKRCKIPYGTKGHVFWTGDSRYGERVGFRGEDGETHWTALKNVSVVPGHENWEGLCQTCGGGTYPASWVPSKDGKGGHKRCPECSRRREAEAKAEAEATETKAKTPAPAAEVTRGALVEVVKSVGRDAPAGVTGEVFWVGASKFGPGNRIGLKDENGETYWAAEENVRVAA